MKTLQTILFLLGISFFVYSQDKESTSDHHSEEKKNSHVHFEDNSISVGLGTAYSFEKEALGVNARVYYNLGHNICFGPEFSYFNTGETQLLDFNIVTHYIIETKLAGIYPLLGLNYVIETEEFEQLNEVERKSAFGLKYGIGAHRTFNKVTVLIEYSRVQSELKDSFFAIGAFLTFH